MKCLCYFLSFSYIILHSHIGYEQFISGAVPRNPSKRALFTQPFSIFGCSQRDWFSSISGPFRVKGFLFPSNLKSRLRNRPSFYPPRHVDIGSPAMHTNTPFVIRATSDEQLAVPASAVSHALSTPHSCSTVVRPSSLWTPSQRYVPAGAPAGPPVVVAHQHPAA